MLLKVGSRGPQVRNRQHQLKVLGLYHGSIDGIYGVRTKNAVVRFQASQGLAPDGVIGPATASALDRATGYRRSATLRLGSRGEMVALVQEKLFVLGFYHGSIDRIYGSQTEQAVRSFQSSAGLTPDGIVGPRTMMALLETL